MIRRICQAITSLTQAIREASEVRRDELEWIKSHSRFATKQDLKEIEEIIMMTKQQLEVLLNNQTTQVNKIAKEQSDRFDALTEANRVLQELIAAGGDGVSPEIETAAHNVQAALDTLDAAIPDPPAV